ncbi:hypothetical protein NFI96_008016 [Prochilodus magdalenae]|nr:hypothetical protein NFI96_008016 [Prochilodus magdalenae]
MCRYGSWPNRFFRKLGVPGPESSRFPTAGKHVGVQEVNVSFISVVNDFGLNGPLYDALFMTSDEDWKRIRTVLSPSFTSGRLKEMFGIIKTHSDTLVRNLEKTAKLKSGVNLKQLFGAYSMDVITSSAFSVDIDSLNNPKDPFVTKVKKLVDFDFLSPLFLIGALFPFTIPLLEKMNFSFFPVSETDFFLAVLKKIKADRVANNHKSRVDIMQLMVDSQTPEKAEYQQAEEIKKGLSDHEILSQAVSFLFAGYETTSSTLSFFFHIMATNPKAMKKLQEEIDETFPNEAPVQYEELMGMDYLDAAQNESMRLYPVTGRLDRVCKKTVEINGVTIPKGTVVMIPTFSLQRDPEYWPDPETFKPERFTKENKEHIDPYMFMPFGSGPRRCIGMRFALVTMKLAIVQILRRFDVSVCDETKVPLELGIGGFLTPKVPIKLRFTPRANSKPDDLCNNNLSKY